MTEFDRQNYVSPAAAARIAGVSDETIRQYIKAGKVAAVKTRGGRFLIHKDELAALVPAQLDRSEQ